MATQQINISEKSLDTLKSIVKAGGKISTDDFDKRSIRALATRELVKISENKKGIFVAPTAKGKKFIN